MARRSGLTKAAALACAILLARAASLVAADTATSLAGLALSRAQQLMWKGKHEEALKKVKEVLAGSPGMVEAHELYQDMVSDAAKIARVRLDRAKKRQQRAADLRRTKPKAMANAVYLPLVKDVNEKRSAARRAQQAEAKMQAEYEVRFKQSPKSAAAHYLYARLVADLAEKEKLLKRARQLDTKFAPAHNSLGFLYERQGKAAAAEREFNAALKAKPDWAEPHNGLGFLYMNQGKTQDAAKQFEQALKLDPSSVDAHMNLGYLYRRIQRYDDAIEEFKRVLVIDPENPWAQNNLGVCYYRQGLYSQAVKCYRLALDSERYDTPELVDLNLGFVYRRRRQYVLAAHYYREATKIKPGFAYAHSQLAQALYHQKKYDEARQHVKRAQELGLKVNPEFLKVLQQAGK